MSALNVAWLPSAPGSARVLGRVAVDRVADHGERLPQAVVAGGVRGREQARHGDRRDDAQDHHDDDQFDKRETVTTLARETPHS